MFDDDRRDTGIERRHPVVGNDQRLGDRAGRDPGRAGQTERRDTAATRREQRVRGAVEVAVEDHDTITAGGTASEAHRRRRRLGARIHESHQFARRHAFAHRLGEFHLARRRSAVGGTPGRRLGDRSCDRRMGVPEDDRPVALHEVDVLASLDIPHVGTLGPCHQIGPAADRPERADGRVDPAGDRRARPVEEFVVRGDAGTDARRC
jgi:hypothetical protein